MPAKIYVLKLTLDERAELERVVKVGKAAGWKIQRAQALLKCDQGPEGPSWIDDHVAEAFGCTRRSVENWRKQAVEEGPLSLLERKPRRDAGRTKPDGDGEAQLVKLACSKAPAGFARWSLLLLAGKLVELEIVDSISHGSVRSVIKKNEIKPWLKQMWCIPPEQDAAFVCQMEQVLLVYKRPYDAKRPVFAAWRVSKRTTHRSPETRTPQPFF